MGGLGPGIGGFEILVIGIVALLVVGPKDLPLLMRKIGKVMARARAMANEFRSSFDEMARQSELDELRKEVQALRTGQGMVPLGAEADAAFREIRDDLNRPLDEPVMLAAPDEWPDSPPVMTPLEAEPVPAKKTAAKPRKAATKKADAPVASIKTASGKARPIRAKRVDL
ncbi:MAG: Sec-independent protein translocase protein TatB [Brevundimonas sp.]|uniref:Sec-independent protein translocase protein TatB n=1 Tax=Brevundimonas sp. TaxID=1871086 RepID=UPI002715A8C7|nr:Sec-independent protein translocase protein TatB [Brevundimonas sp.]MDO9079007.1 Sec-independent protein translocase protein TatB [Brevundimonas sp.]MDP3368595.1 Sec-independent protein translocase protein TatB [Brevundimonas sp.]MDZ4061262.1 Sec-independent protein translocase protein TatB [Brevundimonas sp.]